MELNLNLLKDHLHRFAYECNLTIEEIGQLADNSLSVSDFNNKLDELCEKNINKDSWQVLAEFDTKFADHCTSLKPAPTENSPLQNELVEAERKINELDKKDKNSKTLLES